MVGSEILAKQEIKSSNISDKKTSKRKILIIVVVCIIIFAIIFLVLFLTGKNKGNCEDMDDIFMKEWCETCSESEDSENCMDDLFYIKAREKDDKKLCEKISDEDLQDSCLLGKTSPASLENTISRPILEPIDSGGYGIKSS